MRHWTMRAGLAAGVMCLAALGCEREAEEAPTSGSPTTPAPGETAPPPATVPPRTEPPAGTAPPTTPPAGEMQESDRRIATEVRRLIDAQESVSASARGIDIVVRDGVVTLRGNVASNAEREAMEDIAESVDGVEEVRNELLVPAEGGAPRNPPPPSPAPSGGGSRPPGG